jgi:hypothetical protein
MTGYFLRQRVCPKVIFICEVAMRRNGTILVAILLIAAGSFAVGYNYAMRTARTNTSQPGLMHVFLYTPLEGSTPQDFATFDRATRDMVGKVPGLRKVWVGKLAEPLPYETKVRIYGVAMEFDDQAALAVYARHPVHEEWIKSYEKVRESGTTTVDIVE